MALLILTPENLYLVKCELRARLPRVASSHLTEAIAASLGFRTNAAVRAAMAANTTSLPAIAGADADSFSRRLAEFRYPAPDPALLRQAIRSGNLPDRPYAEFPRGDIGANNAFYEICERRSRPIVTVAIARRYAELQWDCLSIDPDHDSHARSDPRAELVRTMFAKFQARTRGAPGKPYFTGSAFTGCVERLLPEIARDLADDFFGMLYSPVRESFGRRGAA